MYRLLWTMEGDLWQGKCNISLTFTPVIVQLCYSETSYEWKPFWSQNVFDLDLWVKSATSQRQTGFGKWKYVCTMEMLPWSFWMSVLLT